MLKTLMSLLDGLFKPKYGYPFFEACPMCGNLHIRKNLETNIWFCRTGKHSFEFPDKIIDAGTE